MRLARTPYAPLQPKSRPAFAAFCAMTMRASTHGLERPRGMNAMRFRFPMFAAAILAFADPTIARAQGLTQFEVEQLAAQCVTCHQVYFGVRARRASGVPDIRGLEADTIARHLRDFKSGARDHLIMRHIASGFSEQEIIALAAYYASQPRD